MTLKTTALTTILAWWAFFDFSIFFFKTIYETFNKTFFYGLNDMHSGKFYQFFLSSCIQKIIMGSHLKKNINDFCRNKKSQITTRIFFYFHFLLKIVIKKICLSLFLFWASLIMQTNKKIIEKIKLVKISHCVLATIKCTGD